MPQNDGSDNVLTIGTGAPYTHTEPPLLKSGGGDGTSGDMEARVNRLEERIDRLTDGLSEVKVNVATLSEKVSHLPSKGYIDARIGGMLAGIAALIIFAEKIKAALGI